MASAKPTSQIEKKERQESFRPSEKKDTRSPEQVSSSRGEIVGALAEGMDGSERVSESAAEGREVKGDSAGKKQAKKGDDKGKAQTGTTTFTFDEKNLPPAPEMIHRIEIALRQEIRKLQKKAKYYQGGFFTKADFPKYSETMIEIRKRHVLLRRIFNLAADALKKLFLQMFGAREEARK